jgi:hypothetical protein
VSERENCGQNVCVIGRIVVERVSIALRVVISHKDVCTGPGYPSAIVKILKTRDTGQREAVFELSSVSELLYVTLGGIQSASLAAYLMTTYHCLCIALE